MLQPVPPREEQARQGQEEVQLQPEAPGRQAVPAQAQVKQVPIGRQRGHGLLGLRAPGGRQGQGIILQHHRGRQLAAEDLLVQPLMRPGAADVRRVQPPGDGLVVQRRLFIVDRGQLLGRKPVAHGGIEPFGLHARLAQGRTDPLLARMLARAADHEGRPQQLEQARERGAGHAREGSPARPPAHRPRKGSKRTFGEYIRRP